MRPVIKWDPDKEPSIKQEYKPYKKAKDDLVRNIGSYCSYCEDRVRVNDLHVEHVQPWTRYRTLKETRSNFLLSCSQCNGNKSNKDVILGKLHLPHTHNTYLSILYKEGGLVEVNNSLPAEEITKASELIDLVGLDKRPGSPTYNAKKNKDYRWRDRQACWELAEMYLKKYNDGAFDLDTLIELVKSKGFWSIWFTVFEDHAEVRSALLEAFPGTAKEYFQNGGSKKPPDKKSLRKIKKSIKKWLRANKHLYRKIWKQLRLQFNHSYHNQPSS